MDKPIYDIFNDITYCSEQCPHLEWRNPASGQCALLDRGLNFYDWFIAECTEELKNERQSALSE